MVTSVHAKLNLIPDVHSSNGVDKESFRLGYEWGKKRVTAEATALLPVGGTGLYLSKFNDQHVLATNHHVSPSEIDCVGDKVEFALCTRNLP